MLTPTIRRLIVCGARAENAGGSNVWNGSLAEVRAMSALPPRTDVGQHINVSIWLSVYEYTP